MNHLSQTEQAVQTSYMMTLGNWNDTGQYRRRCEKGEQRQRLEEHRASQSKKTLRLRHSGMKLHYPPNCGQNSNEYIKPMFTEPDNCQAAFELRNCR